MTVLHTNGVHQVSYQYCGCDVSDSENKWQQLMRNSWYPVTILQPATCATFECLDTFRLLRVIATINACDYVTCLEQTTDPLGTNWVPDRYKCFGHMARQWSYLMRLRRAGVGHESGGIASAAPRAVAIQCWACPRVGVNLPTGWDSIGKDFE